PVWELSSPAYLCRAGSRAHYARPPLEDRSLPYLGLLLGLRIDNRLCQFRECCIGRLFFFKRFREQRHRFFELKFLRPSDKSAIARHLVMLDGLCRGWRSMKARPRWMRVC